MDRLCLTRLQVVKTYASRLHCQSGPSAALKTGSGLDRPGAKKPTAQASETMAAARTRFLRVHQLCGMAGRSCFESAEHRIIPPQCL
ncbi:hypothetical protein LMTR3_16425 [Bradyrhizobium sp. LMTR 3]|nr:hypothetical protein LMTR3_16425 [Bradyrhizobium sp. LMTR 3]